MIDTRDSVRIVVVDGLVNSIILDAVHCTSPSSSIVACLSSGNIGTPLRTFPLQKVVRGGRQTGAVRGDNVLPELVADARINLLWLGSVVYIGLRSGEIFLEGFQMIEDSSAGRDQVENWM